MRRLLVISTLMVISGAAWSQVAKKVDAKPVFEFAKVGYYHRFAKDDMHEYTPKGQSDLNKFTDMVTSRVYSGVTTDEQLAATANQVLEQYKAAGGRVVRTNSVPRTPEKPAEHMIAVVFGRPQFIEVAFARFRMQDGKGMSVIYSRRTYGAKVGDAVSKWLKTNGETTEKALMGMASIPTATK